MTKKSHRPSAKKKASSSPFTFGASALGLCAGTFVLALLGYFDYQAHLLASEARVATATVTKNVLHPFGLDRRERTVYEVDYVFTAADGTRIESKEALDDAALARGWDLLKQGDTIPVAYAAGNPQNNKMGKDTSTTTLDLILIGFSVIWLVLATIAVAAARRRWLPHAAPRSRRSKTATDVVPAAETDPPRPVVAKASVSGPTLFGTLLLLFGAGFLLIGVANLVGKRAADRAFRTEGKGATAIVLTKKTGIRKGGGRWYSLGIRFTTDEGKSVVTDIDVDLPTLSSLYEHYPIKIIYMHQDPTQIRLPTYQAGSPRALWFFTALGGVIATGGAVMLGFVLSDAKRKRLLHGP